MEKFEIAELIKISDVLNKDDMLVALLNINNSGKLRQFMKLLGKQDLLNQLKKDRANKKIK